MIRFVIVAWALLAIPLALADQDQAFSGPGAPLRLASPAVVKIDGIHPVLLRLRDHPGIAQALARNGRVLPTDLPPDLSPMAQSRQLRVALDGSVQVMLHAARDGALSSGALEAAGFREERRSEDGALIQGWLSLQDIDAVRALPGVLSIELPDYAHLATGSVTTSNDAWLWTEEVRKVYEIDGTGVRVGVISGGLYGLAQAQGTADLPPDVNYTSCNVTPADPRAPVAGAEGTAMLEIVHDLAPGAELWFGYFGYGAGGTALDFTSVVDCLAQYVDVIVDDVVFYNAGPYDGTSIVSQNIADELNRPENRARAYFNAVGNEAITHYQEPWVASPETIVNPGTGDTWVLHRYQATAQTIRTGNPFYCGISGTWCANTWSVPAGAIYSVAVSWNDPWDNSTNDYDLFLLSAGDQGIGITLASAGVQNGPGDEPAEAFVFQNTAATGRDFGVAIGNYNGTATPRTFEMFVRCLSGCQYLEYLDFNTIGSSVPNGPDAGGGAFSLGAVDSNSSPMAWSSRGPTNDGRLKPDAVAQDGSNVSGAGGFPAIFNGTSSIAPHAGGIAALLLSCRPDLRAGDIGDDPAAERTALRDAIAAAAEDVYTAGVDQATGHGRMHAYEAAKLLGCAPRIIDTYAGGGTGGDGSHRLDVAIKHVRSLAFAPDGSLWFGESNDVAGTCRLRKITADTVQALAGNGSCLYTGDGPPTAVSFRADEIAFAPNGDAFIADTLSCFVYRLTAEMLTRIAGSDSGNCTYGGDGGPALNANLNLGGLAVANNGDVYVTDKSGCRIRRIANSVITTVAGTGTCNYSPDGQAVTMSLYYPGDIEIDVDGQPIFVDDSCYIRKLTAQGQIVTILRPAPGWGCSASGGDFPADQAGTGFISDVEVGADGAIYLEDRVVREMRNGWVRARTGWDFSTLGDGRPAREVGVSGRLAVGSDGSIYIGQWMLYERIRSIRVLDSDSDGVLNSADNCTTAANPQQENSDGDIDSLGLMHGDGLGDVCDSDDDSDVCSDEGELGTNPALGGQRDPLNYWDYYDVNRDRRIDLNDALDILAKFGLSTGDPGYDRTFDRDAPAAQPWRTAQDTSGNGIDLTDVLVNLQSFGHDCGGPP